MSDFADEENHSPLKEEFRVESRAFETGIDGGSPPALYFSRDKSLPQFAIDFDTEQISGASEHEHRFESESPRISFETR